MLIPFAPFVAWGVGTDGAVAVEDPRSMGVMDERGARSLNGLAMGDVGAERLMLRFFVGWRVVAAMSWIWSCCASAVPVGTAIGEELPGTCRCGVRGERVGMPPSVPWLVPFTGPWLWFPLPRAPIAAELSPLPVPVLLLLLPGLNEWPDPFPCRGLPAPAPVPAPEGAPLKTGRGLTATVLPDTDIGR